MAGTNRNLSNVNNIVSLVINLLGLGVFYVELFLSHFLIVFLQVLVFLLFGIGL